MPDYRYRVRQSADYAVVIKADSYEDGLDFLHKQLEQATDDPAEQLNLTFKVNRWETDGGEQLPDLPRVAIALHQAELHDPEFDTESSESRQHWIETGLYLTYVEIEEENAVLEAMERGDRVAAARLAQDALKRRGLA